MHSVYFVSGIDTGVGKTVATGLMSRFLRARGVDHCTVKMVQTGCDGFSEDLDAHRAIAGMPRLPEDEEGLTAPQIFRFPASAALAARLCRPASRVEPDPAAAPVYAEALAARAAFEAEQIGA